MAEEALQITEKKEVKGKGKREKNRGKNRMGMTRDLFKEIRDIKGTFYAKVGKIKDREGKDLKKHKSLRRGGKNTELHTHTKILNGPDNHNGVVTHLKCEVKWALESTTTYKASLDDRIPAKHFKS